MDAKNYSPLQWRQFWGRVPGLQYFDMSCTLAKECPNRSAKEEKRTNGQNIFIFLLTRYATVRGVARILVWGI